MNKRYDLVLTVLFCGYLTTITALSILLPEQHFSPLENRYLQARPNLSLKTLQNGQFMQQAENYVSDHLVGRDSWIALKAYAERLSGKRENNGVFFAEKDTLIASVPQPDAQVLENNLKYLNALVESSDLPVYFGLIPSSAAVWGSRLPNAAPTADELGMIADMYARSTAVQIDLADALQAHSGEDIYYRTDHHWTSLGAFYGANAVFTAMDLPKLDLANYEKTTVSNSFYGTAFSTSGVRWLPPDKIDTYVPQQGITVTSYFDAAPTQGALYVPEFLAEKDKYRYFLGGNQSLCVIKTEHTNAPRVLVVRDSYADALAPFLTARFSEIHLFDLRYNLNSIQKYCEDNRIDVVVVLYSCANFAQGTNMFALAR